MWCGQYIKVGAHIFFSKKFTRPLKIPRHKKFHTQEIEILGASLKNKKSLRPYGHPKFLHPCMNAYVLCRFFRHVIVVESSWNLTAHGDARERNWRANWRMECVASTLPLYLGTRSIQHYLLTYLRTFSMVQSPSSEANWFAASQEIPRIEVYGRA